MQFVTEAGERQKPHDYFIGHRKGFCRNPTCLYMTKDLERLRIQRIYLHIDITNLNVEKLTTIALRSGKIEDCPFST